MGSEVFEPGMAEIPLWVKNLTAFRRWADSDDFPEHGRICYIQGNVWIDLSREDLFTHVFVKSEIAAALGRLVKTSQEGLFLGDGAMWANVNADIAVIPDAIFASASTLENRLRLIDSKGGGYDELEGSPDMVLEVVSRSSVRKDTEVLRQAYWDAGVREYWLVDARSDPLTFDILRHTPKGYRATPKKDGWVKSAVFGKSFRLTCGLSDLQHPEYTLETR